MKTSSKTGFSTFSTLGLLITILKWRKQPPLARICCFIFPLEIILASLSGRSYAHYYIPLLSSGTILIANLLNYALYEIQKKITARGKIIKKMMAISLMALFYTQIYVAQKIALENFNSHDTSRAEAAAWINKNIDPNKTILILGAETGIYYITKRKNVCRFVYQYPIIQKWSKKEAFATEFETCYFSKKPDYIIDAMQTDEAANALFIKDQKDDPQHPKILNFIWSDLNKKYIPIYNLDGTNWKIYKKLDEFYFLQEK